jgi:hypothetical protein
MVVTYPPFLEPYAAEVTILLVFIDGLLFGFALKKAFVSVVLIIVAFIIAYFLGLTFIPNISLGSIVHQVMNYSSAVHFGSLIVSFTIVVFFIGLGIGLWRG